MVVMPAWALYSLLMVGVVVELATTLLALHLVEVEVLVGGKQVDLLVVSAITAVALVGSRMVVPPV